jgi:hypothetical protein
MVIAHDFASVFPLMPDDAIRLLAADILVHGLRTPILLHPDGRILDGRARARACELLNIMPPATVWNGIGSPFVLLVHLNLPTRQLTAPQLAVVAARIYLQQPNDSEEYLRQHDIAALVGVHESSLHRAAAVVEKGVPELLAGILDGTVTLGAGREVSQLPEDEQRIIVAAGTTAQAAERNRRQHWQSLQPPKLPKAGEERRARIRELAAAGHDSSQIAAAVGITLGSCRNILKAEHIDCPGDKAHGRARRHDPVRIIQHIVMDAENLLVSADLIDYAQLSVPSARLAEWIATLEAARDSLGSFIRKLKKERSHHDNEAA